MIDTATQLAEDFHELSRYLHTSADHDAVWPRVVELAVRAVPGCEWASVLKAARAHRPPVPIAASAEPALDLDRAQCAAGQGPGVDAAANGGPVTSDDLATESRWPRLTDLPAGRQPVRAVASFRIAEDPSGMAINFYGAQVAAFDTAALGTAGLLATHAGTLALHLDCARKVANLGEALNTSRTIGSAVGIVMLARKLTSDQAFDVLREMSQRMHVKIRDLALLVTETGELPQLPPAPQRPAAMPSEAVSIG